MNVTGSCHCGAVTFEAQINPAYVIICHCTDCQVISSAPYRVTAPVKAANLRLHGTPSTYIKTGDSGTRRKLAFCGTCGAALYTTSLEEGPDVINLRWGVIHQRRELTPLAQGYCRSRLPWAVDLSDIEEVHF